MPTSHASDCSTKEVVGPPITSARIAEAVTDTCWWLANGCSQLGMVDTGTNADDANTNGAITGKAAAWAVSGSPTASPTVAKIHDIAYPNASTSSRPKWNATLLVWIRHPTR